MYGRILKHLDERDVPADYVTEPVRDLHHEQRVSSKLKKVIFRTDFFDVKHFLPNLND